MKTKSNSEVILVIKRNGKTVDFNATKISVALTKAFMAATKDSPNIVHRIVETLTLQIVDKLFQLPLPNINIETIQDIVELVLMTNGHQKVARAYVIYREEHTLKRANKTYVVSPAILNQIKQVIDNACMGLSGVNPELILKEILPNLFDGIKEKEISKTILVTTRTFIEKEPNYSFVASRILLNSIHSTSKENINHLESYFKVASDLGLITKSFLTYDLERLNKAIDYSLNLNFDYLGLQTLCDRYLIKYNDKCLENPQFLFMRVAMALAENEEDKNIRAIEFYDVLSKLDFMSATPTLFNAGTLRPQLSSCFLTTVPDSLAGIFDSMKDNALLAKYCGGLGNDWTNVRGLGSAIKDTGGKSQGIVPFLKIANDTTVAVNQGGKRKGATCAYLETWHIDIEEFLELRKNTGDDRRRTHDMNTANWIPDLFMQRVIDDKSWTLFTPEEAPKLHETFGSVFDEHYERYEVKAEQGEIKNFKRIPAKTLWRKMLSMLFETGHPWITFKDTCNLRSPQQHVGTVHSSNLCTEITLNTSNDEIAVCNLGSVNLSNHVLCGDLDITKLKKTIVTAIRMLDNVIECNFYAVEKAKISNIKHRPIALGIMGFQDILYQLKIPYASEQAVEFADRCMEFVSFYAIEASCDLARERGSYSTFKGSLWHKGILPIDSVKLPNRTTKMDKSQLLDWDKLRGKVIKYGMRNSNVMAIAPTATIANICGAAQSIEPTYQNIFVKSNMSGEFTIINASLVADLKELNLWDEAMIADLKYHDGSVQKIKRVPNDIKKLYKTAFEVEPIWLIKCASRRQKWIDQSQSLNLYIAEPSGQKLDEMYKQAWRYGLKTTYYLRALGATHVEKSTVKDDRLNAVFCSIDDEDCESCQ